MTAMGMLPTTGKPPSAAQGCSWNAPSRKLRGKVQGLVNQILAGTGRIFCPIASEQPPARDWHFTSLPLRSTRPRFSKRLAI